ncbi:cob(I)alamin adenosyltransferase [Alkalibacterium putridalgicola]|uniref:Corrinoid adenosyltransferase n=2 Tax=Alkalibacterium putridalgicola TaxID=426703 RepID=A0A1H7PZ57_9LACT|nr:ATP:cob(I)alamin adenosyltransferase [Alkalibacterium putridalgicola]SEL41042.1 cob(I)alamin adenosyltransferase [Alkalibacterium putridalgicola]
MNVWGARMKIYTGRGDHGNTNLIGGQTVRKTDVRVDAYGSIDELNAQVGLLASLVDEEKTVSRNIIKESLSRIQHNLFDIGSILADKGNKLGMQFDLSEIQTIEQEIDELTEKVSEINYFILPGGAKQASQAHIARTVTRRVERTVLKLNEKEPVAEPPLIYLNRLSDYFFVLARYLNKLAEKEEVYYTKTGKVFHNDERPKRKDEK